MNTYEDNAIGLDNPTELLANEFHQIIDLVEIKPNKENNLDEIFNLILNKNVSAQDDPTNKLTSDDLSTLDRFGTALAK